MVGSPVLVWELPGQSVEAVVMTESASLSDFKNSLPPTVYELKKSLHNAFAMGITVGRTPNNDITLELRSVSRFHAYFHHEPTKDAWTLVDADSKLGTYVNGARLSANVPFPISDKAKIKFGSAELLFFSPDAFLVFASKWRAA